MNPTIDFLKKQRYLILLLTLVLFQVLPPLVEAFPLFRKFSWGLLFTMVMAAAAYTEGKHYRTFKPMLFLGLPTLIFHWLLTLSENTNFESQPIVTGTAVFLYLSFFGFLFWRVLRNILFARQITLNTIFAAMAGYWLMGMTSGLLFITIERLSPGSFNLGANNNASDLMYYAFITLTTVGYGEIVPVQPFARNVAVNLAIFGQMYLTILLAFLVGKFASGEGEILEKELESIEKEPLDDNKAE